MEGKEFIAKLLLDVNIDIESNVTLSSLDQGITGMFK